MTVAAAHLTALCSEVRFIYVAAVLMDNLYRLEQRRGRTSL